MNPSKPRELLRFILGTAIAGAAACVQPAFAASDSKPAAKVSDDSPLTASRMFQILAADLAIQRGEYEVGAKIYLELANNLKDPRLARRAAQAATLARKPELVLEAAKIWATLEPDSPQARNTLAAVMVSQGTLADSKKFLVKWVAESADPSEVFRALNRVFASQKDRRGVFEAIREVAGPYDIFDAHMAVAQAGAAVDTKDAALLKPAIVAVDRALQLMPGSDPAAEVKAEILMKTEPQAAIRFLTEFGGKYPNARDSRYLLARILLSENKTQVARDALIGLVNRWPDDVSMQYVLALSHYELKDFKAAEAVLVKLIDNDESDHDRVLTLLGQVHEDQKRWDDAIVRYREVGEGELYFSAQQRIALVLGKAGKVAEARAHLKTVSTSGMTSTQKIQLILTEGNVLRDAQRVSEAIDLLDAESKKHPESSELLYDLAMAAEKLDKLDVAETALKKVIALKPDEAQGYNALGYTLVDRTNRIDEGLKLIEKAHAISPEDAFILDSMGWAYYRLGDLQKSAEYLRRAFAKRADPEVAAHLGEVLWKMGEHEAARKVWNDALTESPSHPLLTETMKRVAK
jgi:tetratricopeptide (TPR) repeat protein